MFPLMMIYLVLVLIRPQDYPALQGQIPVPVQQLTLVLAAIAWVFSGRRFVSAPQNIILPIFLLAMMASVAVNGWVGGAVYVFVNFAPVLMGYYLLANAVHGRRRMRIAMGVFACCACVLALHGIMQSATGTGWTGIGLSQATRIQYVGIFNDPNDLGMLFVIGIPMAVYLSAQRGYMGLLRLFWWGVTLILVYGVYLTDSRGTVLALLALFGAYIWKTRGIFVAGVLGTFSLGGLMAMPSRMQELEVGEESAMDRVYSWYEGMQMFKEHPILGVGKGAYTELYQLTAHNSLVLVLAEIGIVGFTLWLMFMGYSFWMMWRIVRWRVTPEMAIACGQKPDADFLREWNQDSAIATTLLLSLLAFSVSAFFLSRTYVVTLYLLVGLVVAHYGYVRNRYRLPAFQMGGHLLLWPVVSAAAAVGMYIVVRILLVLA